MWNTDDLLTMNMICRQGRMLEEISGMYSSVFGTKAGPALSFLFQAGPFLFACCFISFFLQAGPDREKHPVVFLPDGSKKV